MSFFSRLQRTPSIEQYYHDGRMHYGLEEYSQAITCFDKVLSIDPDSAKAWYWKGLSCMFSLKAEEAITCIDKTIQIDPNCSRAWHMRGWIFELQKRYDEAVECYQKASQLDPSKKAGSDAAITKINKIRYPDFFR